MKYPSTIKEWVLENLEQSAIRDVARDGCSGGDSGLIYYDETNNFHDVYEDEIWEMIHEEKENFGTGNILEFLSTFNGAKNVASMVQLKNLLCWYAVEQVCRQLILKEEDR